MSKDTKELDEGLALIDELKKDHAVVKDVFSSVSEMDLSSQQAIDKILTIKDKLVKHLQKEDTEIYSKYKQKCPSNEKLLKIIESFEYEADLISKFAIKFFSKYSEQKSHEDFQKEFDLLFSTLIKRIKHEEEVLYVECEQLLRKRQEANNPDSQSTE